MRCARGRAGLDDVIRSIVSLDPRRVGNRGSHRYSCGTAECTHQQHAWAALVDPPALMAILAEVFETEQFVCNTGTGGADFTLPGALDFQHLHSDGVSDNPNFGQAATYRDVKVGTRPDGSTFWQELPEYYTASKPVLKLDQQANKQPAGRLADAPPAEVSKIGYTFKPWLIPARCIPRVHRDDCSAPIAPRSELLVLPLHSWARARILKSCCMHATGGLVVQDPRFTYRVVNYRELPVSHVGVTVNYPMEVGGANPQGQTAFNGATRQVRCRSHGGCVFPL